MPRRDRSATQSVETGARYLFFTNECVGLGHLRRTMTLAGAVTAADDTASALVVTGSPVASSYTMPPRVETLKLPALARTTEGAFHSPRMAVNAGHLHGLRSQLALAAAQSFDPDVVVVDKTPVGLRDELRPMLTALHRSGRARVVLGLRDIEDDPAKVRRVWQAGGVADAVRRFYDTVLVYGPDGSLDALACAGAEDLGVPVHHVGFVASPLPEHAPADLPADYLLVTAGGGVDGTEVVAAVLRALRLQPIGIPTIVVAGPLLPADDLAALQELATGLDVRIETFRADLDAAIVGARAVVAMAGYNTVSELLRAGTPALLVPRARPSSEQLVRAGQLAGQGLVDMLHPDVLHPMTVRDALGRLLARPRRVVPVQHYDGATRAADVLRALALEAQLTSGAVSPLTLPARP